MASLKYPRLNAPLTIGSVTLKNRFIMASLVRNRGIVPNALTALYYQQRAGAGLIMTEATLIEPAGTDWPDNAGIWSEKQVESWKAVVDAVHEKGGLIGMQLVHPGRVANALAQCGQPPVAPSAIQARTGHFRYLKGDLGFDVPEAIQDPRDYVEMFREAARKAKRAGFDFVELHGANGWLPNQFMDKHSNTRSDIYGGSVENRARFALDCIRAFAYELGDASRVGIKITPANSYNDVGDPLEDAVQFYTYLVQQLDQMRIGYIQVTRYMALLDELGHGNKMDVFKVLRPHVHHAKFILQGGLTVDEGEQFLDPVFTSPLPPADAISFGRLFISNPDLPMRCERGIFNMDTPMQTWYGNFDQKDLYPVGYTDLPALDQDQPYK
jgi:2,4-dienoyl-CoA reductase-like NADH-dependent reductase (Old Yellow Enzyme family)